MNTESSLLAPGPVNIHPKVREALALPMIHHRTPEFDGILARVLGRLKKVFMTSESVFLLSSTGSGGMEALIVNPLSSGDEVLVIDSGKFGERWVEMCKIFGLTVHIIKTVWGEPVSVDEVRKTLTTYPRIRAVFCQACETSTGVKHPIQELGALIQPMPETLFLVDGITALGAFPLKMDEWGIDGLVAGSQKAFMLPTGLAFVAFSKKAWPFIEKGNLPRFYFDVRKEKKANANGETFFSSSVALIRALDVVLDLVEKQGIDSLFAEIRKRAEFTRLFGAKLGFLLYSKAPSESLTAFVVPAGFDGQKIRLHLESRYNITIMGGQEQAKGKIIRVGHMGYIQNHELVNLIKCLGLTLQDLNSSFIDANKISKIAAEAEAWLQNNP
ncbi:MAG: alanine--glyoxylate aminotransferase family protein [Pseudobdellovibrionaceae bacterium]